MSKEINEVVRSIRTHLQHQKEMGVDFVPKKNAGSRVQGLGSKGLDDVRKELGDCKRCKLHKTRANIVFGVGDPKAKLMFVGEGPGADEDAKGEPFVGRAGQLLTKIIQAMGLERKDVYIGNCVKCLKYNAMVQLGNGKWERIGRLVRQQYAGTVRSVDDHGQIVEKSVIGWHATALGKRSVYKLSFNSAKGTGLSKCAIYLTGDHPVLTKRGYVPAEKLKSTDSIATGQGLSKTLKELVYGMLLGDGHISKKHSGLSFSHSQKQEDYAKFKLNIIGSEFKTSSKYYAVSAGYAKTYPIIKCATVASRSFRIIRNRFYNGKKKIVPQEVAQDLSPMMLAVWFMDDGYLRIRPPRNPSAEIATCAFSKKDLGILVKGIKNIGIDAYILKNRIHFDVKATKILSKIIAPYVPPSMRWKIHPEIEPKIPFNPKLFDCSNQETLFDSVVIKKIKHTGSDKTFFCVDVEDTNNFVTTGGVVHNCRPPENRNPEPDELLQCMPFLKAQIMAIKPEVIVALGAVATKTLLEEEIPISKVRGKILEWNGTKLIPTFHPAYLLRNPPAKKEVWEDMQVVMKVLGLSSRA